MDNSTLASDWLSGLTKERRGSNMRADSTDIYSYNMIIARKYPEGYFVFNNEDYSVTTAKHKHIVRSVLLDHVGYANADTKIVNVSSRWSGTLPPVGDALQTQLCHWLPSMGGPGWSTVWEGASPAVQHLYPNVVDNTTGRVKAGLWGGDPQTLRTVLGDTGGRFDLAVLEHLAVDSGLDAAEAFAKADNSALWHTSGGVIAKLLLCYGATTIPTGAFSGYTGQAWKILMATPVSDRPAVASEMLLRNNRFFKEAAIIWLQNYNANKENHHG